MNTVKLTQSKTNLTLKAEINGEQVSEFSDLSTILQASFLNISEQIISHLDAEIYDEYQITFSGFLFQYEVISSYAKKSQYCKNIIFDNEGSFYSEKEMVQIFSSICNNYNLTIKPKKDQIAVYSEINLPIFNDNIIEASATQADVCIYENLENISYVDGKTILLLGETLEILKTNGKRIIQLQQSILPQFFEFYNSYCNSINYISECRNALTFVRLSSKEEKQINSILNNTSDYYINGIPAAIDDTDSVTFEFESYPKDMYYISCDNPNILNVTSNKIVPLASGKTCIHVKDKSNSVVYTQELEIISHQYVSEIRVIPRFSELRINERGKIDTIVIPQSAEDAKDIMFESSDENILTIDNSGNVLALNLGTVTITVSCKKTKSAINITIIPNLEKIYFSEETINLKIGHSTVVECNTIPATASTNGFIWQIDNNSIASINYSPDGKKCKITAATQKEGKGNLRCYDPKTGFSAVCPVNVYARIKLNLIQKLLFLISVIGFFCAPILLIPIIIDIIFLIVTKENHLKKVYIINIILSIILAIAGTILFS